MFEDLKSKSQELREQAQSGSQEAREKLRELFDQTREKLIETLTPEQREKMRSMIRPEGPPTTGPAEGRGRDGNARERVGPRQRRGGNDGAKPPAQSNAPPDKNAGDAAAQVGQPAPAFALKKLDGALVQLSSLKGRVIVLEFGSWTCPAFRDRAPAMEKLRNDYGTRAQFFVVYSREAHAKGEWEVSRNKDQGISVDQPRTIESRLELAKKAKEELKIATPILLDTIGNDTSIAYAAGANSALVINRDGIIAARQDWFDPTGLRREIDEAVKAVPATKPATVAAE